jgi:hypothetical protein
MTHDDPVTEYLAERGVASRMVEEGLSGLADRWEAIADALEDGYDLTLDDWLNDMDLRDILAGALAVSPDAARTAVSAQVAEADRRFLAGTLPSAAPLWGEEIAAEEGHDPAQQPWFFRRPKRMGPELAAELENAGLA